MKVLIAGLILVAAALAAIAALPRLAENRILHALAEAGVTDARLTVESVGWREASITDVRIGDGLSIAAITARYGLGDVMDGRIRELAVDALLLRGEASGAGVSFPALDPLLGNGGGGGRIPLDTIILRNSHVELTTPLGDVAAALEGTVHIAPEGDLNGLLEIHVDAANGQLSGRLTFAASPAQAYDAQLEITETVLGAAPPLAGEVAAVLRDGRLAVDGALYTPDGALALTAALAIADIGQRDSPFDLDAELWVTEPPPFEGATMGQGRMAVSLTGSLPASTDIAGLALSGALELDLDEVTVPGIGDGLSLSGAMKVETIDGVVSLATDNGLRFTARRLASSGGALALDLETLRAQLRPRADGVAIDGAASGRLSYQGMGMIAADFAGRLDLDGHGVPQAFDLRRMTASASDLNLGGMIFTLDDLRLSLAGTPDEFSGDARATLRTERFAGTGITLTQPRLSMKAAFAYGGDGFSLTFGEGASLDAASLAVPGLGSVAFHVETAGESVIAITMEAPAATIELPLLRLTGVLGDGAVAADLAGRLDLDADGAPLRFDLRRLTASASDLNLGGVAFAVDGLRLSLAGTPAAFTGDAQATLSMESFAAAGVSLIRPRLSLESTIAYDGGEISLALGEGASLDAESLILAGLEPLAFHGETSGESTIHIARDGRIRHDLRLALPIMEIMSASVDFGSLHLTGVLDDGYSASAEIVGGALGLGGHDLTLDGIDAILELDQGEIHGGFTARALRHPEITPLAVVGSFDLAGDSLEFTSLLTSGALAVTVEGRHRLDAAAGGASFAVGRLAFEPWHLVRGYDGDQVRWAVDETVVDDQLEHISPLRDSHECGISNSGCREHRGASWWSRIENPLKLEGRKMVIRVGRTIPPEQNGRAHRYRIVLMERLGDGHRRAVLDFNRYRIGSRIHEPVVDDELGGIGPNRDEIAVTYQLWSF